MSLSQKKARCKRYYCTKAESVRMGESLHWVDFVAERTFLRYGVGIASGFVCYFRHHWGKTFHLLGGFCTSSSFTITSLARRWQSYFSVSQLFPFYFHFAPSGRTKYPLVSPSQSEIVESSNPAENASDHVTRFPVAGVEEMWQRMPWEITLPVRAVESVVAGAGW